MQKIREHIMGQIPETINKFLRTIDSTAIRILGDTPNSVLDHDCYLDSIRPIVSKIEESLREHRSDAQARFLAEMHNGHGNDPLPLVDDHNQTVEYRYPRSFYT